MPFFNTGNAQWDQGFNTLGGALFPDPSKIGQATYYGAEARKAQIDAAKQQEQLVAGHQLYGTIMGHPPGPPRYAPTGPLGITTLQEDNGGWGGEGGGPPSGPASAPAPVPGPNPAAPPPPAAAPPSAPGPVGSNLPPGGLASLFAQGGGAVPNPDPVAIGNAITATVDNSSGAPGATVGKPAASAPPAPQTTGSDGSVPPAPDHSVIHPGTFTPPGGGVKVTGPAAADGSPAPLAVNLAQISALAALKGLPADQANQLAQSVIGNWVKNGQMDARTADTLLASYGQAGPRVETLRGQTAVTTTAMTVAGQLAAQNIVTNEKEREFLNQEVQVRDPTTGQSVFKKRRDLQPGDQAYDSTIAQIGAKPTDVQPGGPGTPVISVPTSQAQREGTPIYTPQTSDQSNAQIQQRIMNEPDPVKRQQLIERIQQASPRPPPTSAEVFNSRQLNYQSDQADYPTPQETKIPLHITAPMAFNSQAQAVIDERAQNLMDQNRRLDLSTAHQRAITQLQAEGKLYTPDEVNAMRAETSAATLGGRWDARIQNYAPPGGKPSNHLMIGLKPPGQPGQPPAQPGQPPPAPGAVAAQPPTSPVQPSQPPAPAQPPVPAQSLSTVILNPAQRTGSQPLPVVRPVITRDPAQANSPLARGAVPQPVVPQRSQVSPTQMQTTDIPPQGYGTAPPPGAIGAAAANAVENQIVHGPGGTPGVVHGGWVFPLAAAPANAGG